MNRPNMFRRGRQGRGGFTLVELLLVLVILATLAAIVVPNLAGRGEQARQTAARTEISTIGSALNVFEVDMGYYPSTADGLDVLLDEPAGGDNWRGPYLDLEEIPLDPWGNEYVYEYPARIRRYGFDLYSVGPDGRPGTEDDIGNWQGRDR